MLSLPILLISLNHFSFKPSSQIASIKFTNEIDRYHIGNFITNSHATPPGSVVILHSFFLPTCDPAGVGWCSAFVFSTNMRPRWGRLVFCIRFFYQHATPLGSVGVLHSFFLPTCDPAGVGWCSTFVFSTNMRPLWGRADCYLMLNQIAIRLCNLMLDQIAIRLCNLMLDQLAMRLCKLMLDQIAIRLCNLMLDQIAMRLCKLILDQIAIRLCNMILHHIAIQLCNLM